MKNLLAVLILVMSISNTFAQESTERGTTFAVQAIHNSAAGFSPVVLGSIPINDKLDLTMYGIFWTNTNFGLEASPHGGDLFIETGIGLGFKLLNDKWFINPSLGFGHGKFLSLGEGTLVGEGIIPSVFTTYNQGSFEFEAYLAYYGALRKGGPVTRDFLLNWIAPGVSVHKRLSLGAYYEQFVLTRSTDDQIIPEDSVYQWLGGYLKLKLDKGISFRIAAGKNLATNLGHSDEFYKISAFIPIN